MADPMAIVVDHLYQRPEKQTLIERISANFDPMLFGRPSCFKRGNGMLYCIDGQQRLAGAKAAGLRSVPVVVFDVVGAKREAEVFVEVNEARKALSGLEKHRGKIVAEDPAALQIERAVETAGFSVAVNADSPRAIASIGALGYAHKTIGEEGIVQLLTVAREAWGEDKKLTGTQIIRALTDIIDEQRKNGGYTRSKLCTALKRTSPAQILRKAEEIHFDQGTSKRDSVRRAFKALAKV
jgi:ParB-like chromosome segregation protein Spo0J